MHGIEHLYLSYPFWVWLAIAAVFLASELVTGSGWLLAPSACAALMALMRLAGVDLGVGGDLTLYAGLTVIATLGSRSLMRRKTDTRPDINDRPTALVGKSGVVVADFHANLGRVLVDGAEWDAEIDPASAPQAGTQVEVVRAMGGSKLAVRRV